MSVWSTYASRLMVSMMRPRGSAVEHYSTGCSSGSRTAGARSKCSRYCRRPRAAAAIFTGAFVMIKAIKFVSVPVRDQDRALAFYTGKLGLQVVTDQPFDDRQRWIELRIGGADTRLVLFTPHGHEERIGSFVDFAFV